MSHCLTNFYTHGNNLIPISVPTHLLHKLAITDFSKEKPQFYCPRYTKMYNLHQYFKDGYRDQIVTCIIYMLVYTVRYTQ